MNEIICELCGQPIDISGTPQELQEQEHKLHTEQAGEAMVCCASCADMLLTLTGPLE